MSGNIIFIWPGDPNLQSDLQQPTLIREDKMKVPKTMKPITPSEFKLLIPGSKLNVHWFESDLTIYYQAYFIGYTRSDTVIVEDISGAVHKVRQHRVSLPLTKKWKWLYKDNTGALDITMCYYASEEEFHSNFVSRTLVQKLEAVWIEE